MVYWPPVRWPDNCFTAGLSDPMDDENFLTPVEVMMDDELYERSFNQNR